MEKRGTLGTGGALTGRETLTWSPVGWGIDPGSTSFGKYGFPGGCGHGGKTSGGWLNSGIKVLGERSKETSKTRAHKHFLYRARG